EDAHVRCFVAVGALPLPQDRVDRRGVRWHLHEALDGVCHRHAPAGTTVLALGENRDAGLLLEVQGLQYRRVLDLREAVAINAPLVEVRAGLEEFWRPQEAAYVVC